jgi:RNA polymerase sigma factor (sigma-70 family)
MTRLATLALAATPDGHLLGRFLAGRDEAAFAELVRRYARVVWGTCRRALPHLADAEDAFQAAFLVLVRRATRAAAHPALGPWLHRVAFLTARNLARANRRRAAVAGPLPRDVPAPDPTDQADARLDLDAALSSLSERHRTAVVLCHLQGLSRKEAADRLGCAEGTLSATLAAALKKLRARLAGRDPLAALAAAVAVPPGLSAATARTAAIYTTSALRTAGVSPAVAGLTEGVLRMFWVKKLTAGCTAAALVAGGLFAGLAVRSGGAAQATAPLAAAPQAPAEDPDAAAKRLDKRLADLQKQKEVLDALLADLAAERAKLDGAKREKAAAAELGNAVSVHVAAGEGPAEYAVREVVGGKVAEVRCSDPDILATYLARALRDPKGPKALRVSADRGVSLDQVNRVFAAGAAAGYKTASFARTDPRLTTLAVLEDAMSRAASVEYLLATRLPLAKEERPAPGEIDLSKFAPKKP